MVIHLIKLNALDTIVAKHIEGLLPSMSLTVAYPKQLNDVVLAQVVHLELSRLFPYNRDSAISFNNFEHLNIFNHVSANLNLEAIPTKHNHPMNGYLSSINHDNLDVLEIKPSEIVENKSVWHIDLDMCQLIRWANLVNMHSDEDDCYSSANDAYIYFDADICGFWHDGDSFDSDYSTRVSGSCKYEVDTGEFKLLLEEGFSLVEDIFKDRNVIECFKQNTQKFFEIPNFREIEYFDLNLS